MIKSCGLGNRCTNVRNSAIQIDKTALDMVARDHFNVQTLQYKNVFHNTIN